MQLKGEGASKTKVSALTMFTAVIREQGQPPKNCNTDSLKILFHGPDKKITAKIIGGTLGSFTVGFTPKQAGEYLMEVQFNGKIVGGPLPLIVANGTLLYTIAATLTPYYQLTDQYLEELLRLHQLHPLPQPLRQAPHQNPRPRSSPKKNPNPKKSLSLKKNPSPANLVSCGNTGKQL